jgi:hypothetical protein
VDNPPKERELLFGRIALDLKLITPEQLTDAVCEQEKSNRRRRIGEILLEKNILTVEQIVWVVSIQEEKLRERISFPDEKTYDMLFGQLAILFGFTDQQKLNEALRIQARREETGETFMRLGEILVDKNLMKSEDVLTVIGVQNGTVVICRNCKNRHSVSSNAPAPAKCSACGNQLDPPAAGARSATDYGRIEGFALDD